MCSYHDVHPHSSRIPENSGNFGTFTAQLVAVSWKSWFLSLKGVMKRPKACFAICSLKHDIWVSLDIDKTIFGIGDLSVIYFTSDWFSFVSLSSIHHAWLTLQFRGVHLTVACLTRWRCGKTAKPPAVATIKVEKSSVETVFRHSCT